MNGISLSAGGVLFHGDKVLLVQVGYGPNKGCWMLPGGMVEPGENIEQAAIREFEEETGLTVSIRRMIGMRSGVRETAGRLETGLYVVFEMEYINGQLKKDEMEIMNIEYREIRQALNSGDVIDLTKELIRSALREGGFVRAQNALATNTPYKSYDYYIIQE